VTTRSRPPRATVAARRPVIRRQAGPGRRRLGAAGGVRYIESSAVLAALLEREKGAQAALDVAGQRICSSLTFAEARRGLLRARLNARLTAAQERSALEWLDDFEQHCQAVPITADILTRAGRPFPVEPIRTLDAVHLATAELIADAPATVTVVTRDRRVQANAEALGFMVE
jgi:predicted nucleic acid-binding protein